MFSPSEICKNTDFIRIEGTIPKSYCSLSTDSRNISRNQMFIGLVGEKFDGGKYLLDVCEKGAGFCVVQNNEENKKLLEAAIQKYPDGCFGVVEDTLKFLQVIASRRAEQWKSIGPEKRMIGITGSNGKTTNKEMLFHILNDFAPNKVYATEGNLNNFIGVPLSLLRVKDDHQFAIIEMGTSLPGEIELLASFANPHVGYITNIGSAHLEALKTKEGVFVEKTALFRNVEANEKGYCLINDTDNYLNKYESSIASRVGEGCEFDLKLKERGFTLNGTSFNNLNVLGSHNYINFACCSVIAKKELKEVSFDQIAEACSSYSPSLGRSQVFESNKGLVYFDAYNANPDSMESSINGFLEFLKASNRKVDEACFILGDMNELGTDEAKFHTELASSVSDLKPSSILFVGRFSNDFKKGAPEASTFSDVSSLSESFVPNENSVYFLKASRSVKLESLLTKFGIDPSSLWKKA